MKKLFSFALAAVLALAWSGSTAVASEPAAQYDGTASGGIVGGFRVLAVRESPRELNLTVYRGDYIKFQLADPATETVLSIPALAIEQKLSGNLDETPYFKMEKTGVFPMTLGPSRGFIAVVDYRQANYREINSKDAVELIRNVAPLVLDVRTPDEYSRGHLKEAVLIPLQQLQVRWREIADHTNQDVLIYCATGNRSTVAAKILIDNGFKRIFNLRQGISGWEREKYPVVQ